MLIDKKYLYLAAVVLAAFTVLPLIREGLGGMKTPFSASFWTLQYFVDLVIALSLVMVWMWHDCRGRGRNPWPWIGATFIVGSFSPLLYLIMAQGRQYSHLRTTSMNQSRNSGTMDLH